MTLGVTIGDSIDRLEATGSPFEFVEFGIGERCNPVTDVDDERLCAALERTQTRLCVHLPYKQDVATPVAEINDAIVAHQRRLLEWAGSLDAEKAVLHATARNPHDTDLRPVFADQLSKIVAAGEDAGVEVVVENVGHQKRGLQLSVLGDIARETETPVCFDVGHAYMEDGNAGVKRFLSGYADLVSHLHVHDVRSRGDTHMPIGAGEIDYGIVADRLGNPSAKANVEPFDGTVAVEVFTDDLELLSDTARRIRDVLERSFDE